MDQTESVHCHGRVFLPSKSKAIINDVKSIILIDALTDLHHLLPPDGGIGRFDRLVAILLIFRLATGHINRVVRGCWIRGWLIIFYWSLFNNNINKHLSMDVLLPLI